MTDWHNYTDESEVIDLIPETDTIELKKGGSMTYALKDETGILAHRLPVDVPCSYIKVKEYNSPLEVFSCIDQEINISGVSFRPPSFGVLSVMESMGNPFPVDFTATTVMQKFHALYINEIREKSIGLYQSWINIPDAEFVPFDADDETTWTELDRAAMIYVDRIIDCGVNVDSPAFWMQILGLFEVAYNGFEMIPAQGGGGSQFLFGAESFGSLATSYCGNIASNPRELFWDTPMALIGFSAAANAKANGTKGVTRPLDDQDIRRQMILAFLRETHGELHPWQIKEPNRRKLTHRQAKHAECVREFARLQAGAKNG